MMVSFVISAFLVGYVVRVIHTILSSSWGAYANLTDLGVVNHGAPVIAGIGFFVYVSFSKTVKAWANEVIIEVSKVVWPSRKDTSALTIFVCFFMIISGIVLGLFDIFSSQVIQFIIEMS